MLYGVIGFIRFYPGFNQVFLSGFTGLCTPGSINSLFSDFFREFWKGYFRGCSGFFRRYVGRFLKEK